MDVKEVEEKNLVLKSNINALLIDFQRETGCYVDFISIDHIKNIGYEKPVGYVVNTKVIL